MVRYRETNLLYLVGLSSGVLEMELLLDVTENEPLLALSDIDGLHQLVDVAQRGVGCLV